MAWLEYGAEITHTRYSYVQLEFLRWRYVKIWQALYVCLQPLPP